MRAGFTASEDTVRPERPKGAITGLSLRICSRSERSAGDPPAAVFARRIDCHRREDQPTGELRPVNLCKELPDQPAASEHVATQHRHGGIGMIEADPLAQEAEEQSGSGAAGDHLL